MTTTQAAMQYATAGERHYARKLVRNLLSRGLSLSVNDGEETTVRRARKETEILAALATTEADYVTAHNDDGARVGVFYLIWGNDPSGEELIADHSDNSTCEAVWRDVMGERL